MPGFVFIIRVNDNQRHVKIIFVHKTALALQRVAAVHLAVVSGKHDDGVVHHAVLFQVIQQFLQVVVGVLDAVKVIVLRVLPDIRAG